MFRVQSEETHKTYRLAMAGLLLLSTAALAVTIWVMIDFLREQEIVRQLIQRLPPDATDLAEELAGELRWQFRLTTLVVLNLIVTGFALTLLWQAYRASQASLRDIKALAGDIHNSMDQAVITTDQDGIVTSINRRGIEILSLVGDYVGRPLSDLTDEIPLEEFRRQSQMAENAKLTRVYTLSGHGVPRTLRAFCQPLHSHDAVDTGNIVQLRDVTERTLIDERLRRMERYMGLGSLAAGLHHEIKNPLAALSLHVQLMEEQLDETGTTDEVRGMIGVIKSEVNRVGGVLEGFRDFASLDQLNMAEVDIPELVERQIKLIAPRAAQQRIEVQVDVPGQPLPRILADRVRLEQLLLNLILNAMESMEGGGTLTLRVAAHEDCFRIAVCDTGPGIPENLRATVFDPYFTTKSEGTGLGLALCDKIARQHQGSLDFHSTPDGTTFELVLPIRVHSASDHDA